MTKRDQLIQKLGAAILGDDGLMAVPWTRLVLIVKFDKASSELEGIAFLKDGDSNPVSNENDGDDSVDAVLAKLRKVMADEDKTDPWVACLIRVSKDSGEINIDFEHNDRDRWEYDPRDRAAMRKTLKVDD